MTYNINIFAPFALFYLALLALGTIPFTAVAVVVGIILTHINLNLTWTQ